MLKSLSHLSEATVFAMMGMSFSAPLAYSEQTTSFLTYSRAANAAMDDLESVRGSLGLASAQGAREAASPRGRPPRPRHATPASPSIR